MDINKLKYLYILVFFIVHQSYSNILSSNDISAKLQENGNRESIKSIVNGYRLNCQLQDLYADVTLKSVTINSVSEQEGKGHFSLKLNSIGKATLKKSFNIMADWIYHENNTVQLKWNTVIEEFTSSSDGIRQDFIVLEKPSGSGDLILTLRVSNAKPSINGDDIKLRMECGRELLYTNLSVSDNEGNNLPAKFMVLGNSELEIKVDDSGAVYPITIDPTIVDLEWMCIGQMIGTDNVIRAIAFDRNGLLYVGGEFDSAGGIPANNIAKWDGSLWSSCGKGLNRDVFTLVVDSLNTVYAGGAFTIAGDENARFVAKWNGTSWSALNENLNYIVNSLAINNENVLYAGGEFTMSGNDSIKYIARWDNNKWHALDKGVSDKIYSITFDNEGTLYAGGRFIKADTLNVNYIAKWDGTNWFALGGGCNGPVRALVADNHKNLYVGGDFDTTSGVKTNYIAKWDGNSWGSLRNGLRGPVSSLNIDDSGHVYAGGNFSEYGYMARWNGTKWNSFDLGMDGVVYAIALDNNNNPYAAGRFEKAGHIAKITANNIARWDGEKWVSFGSGLDSYVSAVKMDKSGNLFVGGNFTTVNGLPIRHIVKWNGSSWDSLGIGADGPVKHIVKDSVGVIYMGGGFKHVDSVFVGYMAKWDGNTWSKIRSTASNQVYVLKFDNQGNLYAGGEFTRIGNYPIKRIAKFDGNRWEALGEGMDNRVNTIAFDRFGNLYAGGKFEKAGDINTNYIAKWDGTKWDSISPGIRKFRHWSVQSIAFDKNDNMFVGGCFDSIGATRVNGIAKWDGTSWTHLDLGMTGRGQNYALVRDLQFDSLNNLYVCGSFDSAGSVHANNVAIWDGSSWSTLNQGLNKSVNGMAFDEQGRLWFGGLFTTAGGKPTSYLARCKIGSSDIHQKLNNKVIHRKIFISNKNLYFTLSKPTIVDLLIYTVNGRIVKSCKLGLRTEGLNKVPLHSLALSNGTYILNLKLKKESFKIPLLIRE